MKIEHVAVWVNDLEVMRAFYERWFGARAGEKYVSARAPFESYFLRFEDGARLELMWRPGLGARSGDHEKPGVGLVHLAVSVGSREGVDRMVEAMREAGVRVIGEPRETGDGYYEAVVADPEGNLIEITV